MNKSRQELPPRTRPSARPPRQRSKSSAPLSPQPLHHMLVAPLDGVIPHRPAPRTPHAHEPLERVEVTALRRPRRRILRERAALVRQPLEHVHVPVSRRVIGPPPVHLVGRVEGQPSQNVDATFLARLGARVAALTPDILVRHEIVSREERDGLEREHRRARLAAHAREREEVRDVQPRQDLHLEEQRDLLHERAEEGTEVIARSWHVIG
mmetsp:Transcript_178/g.672  ORF Transcript_178/g.672 Transcript_178/m.672 type:complete len:210 (+) Transcript_178:3287-3916(+)